MASLGTRIGEYRRQKNVTQEQLAEAMGVTSQAVSKWENDICCPDISLMPKLADYFGVSLDVLIRGERPESVRLLDESQRADTSKMVLRILVHSQGNEVKVNLPLPLIKAGIEMGAPFVQTMHFGGSSAGIASLNQIDWSAIIKLVESGVIGKLVEVKADDGSTVDIFVDNGVS